MDELSRVSLPLPLTALLGRDADVQTLRHWLADPAVRLITLTGPGGAGKTRLALELARANAAEGAFRVLFVGLGAIRHSAFVAPAIAEALGVSDATALELPRRARSACDGSPTLLVLDNFEQVLDAAPLVADLLASVAALRVLVTSRAPLRVRGEREFVVRPLALDSDVDPRHPPIRALSRGAAVRGACSGRTEFRLLTSANNGHRDGDLPTASMPRRSPLSLPPLDQGALTAEILPRRLMHDVLLSTVGPRDLPEPANHECDGRLELSTPGARKNSGCSVVWRAAWSFSGRGGCGGRCRS